MAKKRIPAIINGKQVLIDLALHLPVHALLPYLPNHSDQMLKEVHGCKWTSQMSNLVCFTLQPFTFSLKLNEEKNNNNGRTLTTRHFDL